MEVFTYSDLLKLCENKEVLQTWLREKKILGDFAGQVCKKCNIGKLYLRKDSSYSSDGYIWRCGHKKCHSKISIRKDSWFSHSRLTITKVVQLTYFFVYNYSQELAAHECRVSKKGLVDWYSFCREVCEIILLSEGNVIGGVGKTVEIDESKFGSRKYHRGKRVEGVWVFGGIERESKEGFFKCVADRSAATLVTLIKEHILPGTTVISDCWKAYDRLTEEGYNHLKVNHSLHFKDPETGAHTNTIESTWRVLKRSCLPKNGTTKQQYESYFAVLVIRRRYLNSAFDKFLKFLSLIAKAYPTERSVPAVVREPQPLREVRDFGNVSSNSLDDFQL